MCALVTGVQTCSLPIFLPFAGGFGRGHRRLHRARAGGRRIAPASPAPARHFATAHAHMVEKQLQLELRMAFAMIDAPVAGLARPETIPLLICPAEEYRKTAE